MFIFDHEFCGKHQVLTEFTNADPAPFIYYNGCLLPAAGSVTVNARIVKGQAAVPITALFTAIRPHDINTGHGHLFLTPLLMQRGYSRASQTVTRP